jgi:general secretion pathway protein A
MTAGEVRPYLDHRLRVAGSTGRPTFDGTACAALHAASGGIPRRLNQLVTRVLLMAAIDDVDAIDGPLVERVLSDFGGEQKVATPVVVPVAEAGAPVAAVHAPVPEELLQRVALLEQQVEAQEAALRRVLTLMVDFVEQGDARDFARARSA